MRRRALIIGNTDGIGLSLTRRLLADQWLVEGISRRDASEELNSNERYRHHACDVTSDAFRSLLDALVTEPVDLCVYCAGVGELFDPRSLDADARTVRVNFTALVDACSVVVRAMIERGEGHFIGLSSIGDGVSPEAPAYSASKAGVSAYLEGLALALRKHNVRVTNVRFGFVDTKMAKSPVKPWMIDADQACAVIVRAMRTKPVVVSYPKKMAALVWALQQWLRVRVWVS